MVTTLIPFVLTMRRRNFFGIKQKKNGGGDMWYVIQVRTGTEQYIRMQFEKKIDAPILEKCFIPNYEQQKKIRSEWQTIRRPLFPGYIFLVTGQVEELFFELKKVQGMTRLLATGEEIVPLTEAEIDFIQSFGGKNHVVAMSTGIIEGSRVIVESGPLQGREGLIKKIDRHKRRAWLEIEMFGRPQRVEVGLEITRKIN
jgi:transcriptional antiterminator NusG